MKGMFQNMALCKNKKAVNLLPPKPKSSFRHLKQGIQEFHRKYVLVPADKAANNVVVVCRLHYINALVICNHGPPPPGQGGG